MIAVSFFPRENLQFGILISAEIKRLYSGFSTYELPTYGPVFQKSRTPLYINTLKRTSYKFQHGMALELEPVGIIFTEIRFMNHRVERRAKLQRNRKIFRQKGMSKF